MTARRTTEADKLRKGTHSSGRSKDAEIIDFPVVKAIPKPPAWLKAAAKKEWIKQAELIQKARKLTVSVLETLTFYVDLKCEFIAARKKGTRVPASDRAELRRLRESLFGAPEGGGGPTTRGGNNNPFGRNGVARNKR